MRTTSLLCVVLSTWFHGSDCFFTPPNCPNKGQFKPCSCNYEGISCSAAQTSSQLKNAFQVDPVDRRFRNFWMMGTPVNVIEPHTFEKYSFRSVKIMFNNITAIGDGAFEGSEEFMTELFLNNNLLWDIPLGALKGMKALTNLRLESNKIREVPEFAFKDTPNLETIVLTDNLISSVGRYAFANLTYVTHIDLTHNQLKSLGDFPFAISNPDSFNYLGLAFNQISSLSRNTFRQMASSSLFILASNELETVDEEIFSPIIKVLDSPARSQLMMAGNPIKCDRRLKWLIDLPLVTKMRIIGIICNNVPLWNLKESDLE